MPQHQQNTHFYTYGSAARQLAPQHIPAPRRRPQPARPRTEKRQKPRYIDDTQIRARSYALPALVLLIGILGLIGYLALSVSLDYTNRQIRQLRAELTQITNANEARRGEIYSNICIDEITRIATDELFMALPAQYQFVEIQVPRRSHFVFAETLADDPADEITISGLFSGVWRSFFRN